MLRLFDEWLCLGVIKHVCDFFIADILLASSNTFATTWWLLCMGVIIHVATLWWLTLSGRHQTRCDILMFSFLWASPNTLLLLDDYLPSRWGLQTLYDFLMIDLILASSNTLRLLYDCHLPIIKPDYLQVFLSVELTTGYFLFFLLRFSLVSSYLFFSCPLFFVNPIHMLIKLYCYVLIRKTMLCSLRSRVR